MQDIAGCRIIVVNTVEQDNVVDTLLQQFDDAVVVDRRRTPSFGYRAVHLIPRLDGRSVEVQIRTVLQHSWSELSEKLSDRYDPGIKYGEGDPQTRGLLDDWSASVERIEALEQKYSMPTQVGLFGTTRTLPSSIDKEIEEVRQALRQIMDDLALRLVARGET